MSENPPTETTAPVASAPKKIIDPALLAQDFELLKQIADVAACTGNELPVISKIKELLTSVADELQTDSMGNLYATIRGASGEQSPIVLADAHADEIGFQVVFIENDGFLRIASVGGQNPRILPGARVVVHSSRAGDLLGVIGEKPIHHLSAEDRKKTTEIPKLFVDIGLSTKKDAEKAIAIGDFITLAQNCTRFANSTLVTGKALDDRAGCSVLIRMLQSLKLHITQHGRIPATVVAVFSAQEEIGLRGAGVAAFRLRPQLAIVVEVSHAMDYPGAAKSEYGDLVLGGGPILPIGPNVYPKFPKLMVKLAEKELIPFQTQALPDPAANNARIIQVSGSGVPTGLLKIPLRYMHTAIETLDLRDLHYAADLLLKAILAGPAEFL